MHYEGGMWPKEAFVRPLHKDLRPRGRLVKKNRKLDASGIEEGRATLGCGTVQFGT